MATPIRAIHLDVTASTMGEARAAFNGAPVLVTAASQTDGRGRSGRTWVHADRAVAASLAISVSWPTDRRPVVPLVAGLAAAAVLGTALKWPNDLIHDGLKAGGLLVEADDDVTVIGMGVNLYWPDPVERATALYADDPGPEAPPILAERWAEQLVERLAAPPDDWGRAEYERLCLTVGYEIVWEPNGRGVTSGIDEQGRLVVETPDGETRLDSGEVRHVRVASSE